MLNVAPLLRVYIRVNRVKNIYNTQQWDKKVNIMSTLFIVTASVALVVTAMLVGIVLHQRGQVMNLKKELEDCSAKIKNYEETKPIEKYVTKPGLFAVATEIARLENNLSRMDENTRGYRQLTSGIKRIKTSLVSEGIELVDMLGQPFVEGMNADAIFIDDENMRPGESIITSVQRPQINYHGRMIQAAKITVSQGDNTNK